MHNTVYSTLTKSVVHAGFQLLDWEVSGTLGIRHDVSSMAVSGKLGGLVGEIPDVTHDPRETSGQLVAGQFGPDYHTSPHSIWLLSKVSTTDRQVNLMYLQNFEN